MAYAARTAVFISFSRWSATMQPAPRKLRANFQGERDAARSGPGDRIHGAPGTSIGNVVLNVRSPPLSAEFYVNDLKNPNLAGEECS